MGDYMTTDRMIEIVNAFVRGDMLCEGCADEDIGMPCRECREEAASRLEDMLQWDYSRLIDRAELFNKLAEIKAPPEANEYKAQVYAMLQNM